MEKKEEEDEEEKDEAEKKTKQEMRCNDECVRDEESRGTIEKPEDVKRGKAGERKIAREKEDAGENWREEFARGNAGRRARYSHFGALRQLERSVPGRNREKERTGEAWGDILTLLWI